MACHFLRGSMPPDDGNACFICAKANDERDGPWKFVVCNPQLQHALSPPTVWPGAGSLVAASTPPRLKCKELMSQLRPRPAKQYDLSFGVREPTSFRGRALPSERTSSYGQELATGHT